MSTCRSMQMVRTPTILFQPEHHRLPRSMPTILPFHALPMIPGKAHATFIPDIVETGKQVTIPTHLVSAYPAAFDSTTVFDVIFDFSTLHRWFIRIRLLYPHLTGYVSCLFLLRSPPRIFARSSGRRFADSACTASAEVQFSCLSVRSQSTQFARLPHSHPRCSRAFHVTTQHHWLPFIACVQGTRKIVK